MSMLLDALGYLGDTFDKPGRAVRGLLGGRPEELLAAVPFSDSLGLTDKANRVSGQDLTGMDDGSLLSTLGNMGAEVATDPLTFAGGALGRMLGGRAAEAAVARGPRYGTTADDLLRMGAEADSGGILGSVRNEAAYQNSITRPTGERQYFRHGSEENPLYTTLPERELNPRLLGAEERDALQGAGEWQYSNHRTIGTPLGDPEAGLRTGWDQMVERDPTAAFDFAQRADRDYKRTLKSFIQEENPPVTGIGDHGEAMRSLINSYAAENNPADLARLLSEIHPNSKMLGAGQEAIAFRAPSGEVIRIGQGMHGQPGRPVAAGVLPATSTLDVGTVGRVERSPFAHNVDDRAYFHRRDPQTMQTPLDELDKTLAGSNLELNDRILNNVGTHNGRPVVIDPGAVRPMAESANVIGVPTDQAKAYLQSLDFAGAHSPVTEARDPGRLMTALLNSVGADDAVRRAYAQGLSGPSFGRKLGAFGAAGGADAGILARMLAGE